MAATSPLPELRIGSYLRYKADTNRCLSWLLDAAIAAGYKVSSSPTSRSSSSSQSKISQQHALDSAQTLGQKLRLKQALKETKRKERDDQSAGPNSVLPPVKYFVRTQELIQQAKIAAKKSSRVPPSVVSAFKRAIAARKQSAALYESAGTYSEQSNSQHKYFITLLENIFQIVLPSTQHTNSNADGIQLLNRFQGLDVEDIEDNFEDAVFEDSVGYILSASVSLTLTLFSGTSCFVNFGRK